MTQHSESSLETLREIRSLMERSSRFISLSGLSGVAAGCFALLGAAAMYLYLDSAPFSNRAPYYEAVLQNGRWGLSYLTFFLLDAGLVLIAALGSGIYFTTRKARRRGQPVWDALTRRLLINLLIPLFTGGVFILALFHHGFLGLIAPATLIFYGLALVNASKYTLNDIRRLGITEIALGLTAAFRPGFGLEIWTLGFGVLHIVYGILMYWKYERGHEQVL